MIDIQDFIDRNGVTVRCDLTDANPDMPNGEDDMVHWVCQVIAGDGATVETHFSQSPDLVRPGGPAAADVVSALAADLVSVRGKDLTSWLAEHSVPLDASDAEKWVAAYDRVRDVDAAMSETFGHDAVAELLGTPSPEPAAPGAR